MENEKPIYELINHEGGQVFSVTERTFLERFLIFGTGGNCYYASQKDKDDYAHTTLIPLIKKSGPKVIQKIIEISCAKPTRAPSNTPCIEALAAAVAFGDLSTKKLGLSVLNLVCRIPTHLNIFINTYLAAGGGWGKTFKKGIASWYTSKNPKKLAFLASKYRNREGWRHRDIFRMAHPRPTGDNSGVFRWIMTGDIDPLEKSPQMEYLGAIEKLTFQDLTIDTALQLISEHNLPHEVIPTKLLKTPAIWKALLPSLGYTATIRNIRRFMTIGLLDNPGFKASLVRKIVNVESIRRSRVHPLALLQASIFYKEKCWSWHPPVNPLLPTPPDKWKGHLDLEKAFMNAFDLCFENIPVLNKRIYIGLDVSHSMDSPVVGNAKISCAQASALMAIIYKRREEACYIAGFSSRGTEDLYDQASGKWEPGIKKIDFITKNSTFEEVMIRIENMTFGGTDCALPMIHAREQKIPVDVFMIFTDSETHPGETTPTEALRQYRHEMGIDAKLIVNAMTLNEFTLNPCGDTRHLDVCGFDTSVPQILNEFIKI